jgi:hypothetical protein
LTITVDGILTALADIEFTVWRMDQDESRGWFIVLEDTQASPVAHYRGNGATALEALTRALRLAGVEIEP